MNGKLISKNIDLKNPSDGFNIKGSKKNKRSPFTGATDSMDV